MKLRLSKFIFCLSLEIGGKVTAWFESISLAITVLFTLIAFWSVYDFPDYPDGNLDNDFPEDSLKFYQNISLTSKHHNSST